MTETPPDWQSVAVALNSQLAAERCEVCNSELSQCGVQGVDGEPSLDCLVCKLREQLAAEREKMRLLEAQLGEEFQGRKPAGIWRLKLNGQMSDKSTERKNGHWLGELLAVIHCDGGHYQSEHGTKKATADAIKKRNEMVMRIDELEAQLAIEREALAKERAETLMLAYNSLTEQLAAEKEVGHNTAVALAQQITGLEDQLAALVDALKRIADDTVCTPIIGNPTDREIAKAALAKLEKEQIQIVQLPMINDDPVVRLK